MDARLTDGPQRGHASTRTSRSQTTSASAVTSSPTVRGGGENFIVATVALILVERGRGTNATPSRPA